MQFDDKFEDAELSAEAEGYDDTFLDALVIQPEECVESAHVKSNCNQQ